MTSVSTSFATIRLCRKLRAWRLCVRPGEVNR